MAPIGPHIPIAAPQRGWRAPNEIGCLSAHYIRIDAVKGENRQYRRRGSDITAASRNEGSVEKQ